MKQKSAKLVLKIAATQEAPDVVIDGHAQDAVVVRDAGYSTLIQSSKQDEHNTETEICANISGNHVQTFVFMADQVSRKNIGVHVSPVNDDVNIMTAVNGGNQEHLQSLIKAGADVNVSCEFGGTPLMYAAGNVHNACISILLEAGADVNMPDVNGFTALHISAWAGNISALNTILEAGAGVNITDNTGTTPLIVAAWEGHGTCMKVLIAKGADVNAPDTDGITPLMSSVQNQHMECVRQLIEAGADVNAVDRKGFTALIAAAWTVNTKQVRMLLDAGAGVNRTNCRGQNALTFHVAQCDSANKELVEMLAQAGETPTVASRADDNDDNNNKFCVRRFHDDGTSSFLNLPDFVLELNSCHKFIREQRKDTQSSS